MEGMERYHQQHHFIVSQRNLYASYLINNNQEIVDSSNIDNHEAKGYIRNLERELRKHEAKEVIDLSKRKIREINISNTVAPLVIVASTTATVAGTIFFPVLAIPMIIANKIFIAPTTVVYAVNRVNINKRDHEEKVLLLRLFPEAVKYKHIEKKGYVIVKEIYAETDDRFCNKFNIDDGLLDSKSTILERVIVFYKREIDQFTAYINREIYKV